MALTLTCWLWSHLLLNCLGHCSMSKHGETEEPQALMQFSKFQHDTEEKCEIFFRPNYLIVRIPTLL